MNEKGCEWMNRFWRRTWSVLLAGILGVTTVGTVYGKETEQKSSSEQSIIQQYTNHRAIVQVQEGTQLSYPSCNVEALGEGYYCIEGEQEAFEKALLQLYSREDVVTIQPDYEYHFLETSAITNDSSVYKQWGLYNDGSYSYTDDEGEQIQAVEGIDINAQSAWQQFQSKDEVVVAVLDTGVDYKHEDLKRSMWKNPKEIPGNGKDDDGNGYVDDVYGWDFYNNDKSVCSYKENGRAKEQDNDNHGTHCAGIIAATANNGVGIAGVASNVNVKIMSVKVLGGVNGATTTSKLIKGIRYAVSNGADIINASWGGWVNAKEDNALKSVIQHSGVLVVAAAGNAGENNDTKACYPANYSKELDNVITVGSIDSNGAMSSFSNYGSSVDVLAPGSGIYSTIVGGYGRMSGTSMSVPFVSGIAAMLYAGRSKTYPASVKQVLSSSYRKLSGISTRKVVCPGIIDAAMAVEQRSKLSLDKKVPSITHLSSDYKGNIKVKANDEGGSGVCCILYAKGKKGKTYFRKGTRGKLVSGTTVKVKKAGLYTFYVKDCAGNETISRINITIDTQAPKIRVKKNKKKMTLYITDRNTGIETVRFSYGKKEKEYFKKGKGTFWNITKSGNRRLNNKKTYLSVYAVDRAGNEAYKIFKLK